MGRNESSRGFYRSLGRTCTVLALASVTLASCYTVPITGRSQFNALPTEDDKSLGAQAYGQLLAEARFETSGARHRQVQRVVDRLVAVVDDPASFEWEAKLVVDDATVNAWCLPGGKMAVYTGILPFTGDDTGLAVVMGHEIGHAVARHGTERMTRQLGVQVVLELLAGEGWASYGALAADLLLFLPWGREQELEADHIGLIYMARAGYDPRQAAAFWQRMSAGKGSETLEILSTHPSDATRIEKIDERLPEALAVYNNSTPLP